MSDNIIDFSKRRREHMQSQPVSEVSMETLLQGLTSVPRNDLMASVSQSIQEKITRLLILTDIASKTSDLLTAYGFDPNNFYLDDASLDRYLSGIMDEGAKALWNGPFFDWDADDSRNSTVRVVTTIRTIEEDSNDVSIQLAMELFKLGENGKAWSRFSDGEWIEDGPPADIFDELYLADSDEADEPWDGPQDEEDWEDDDNPRSIYMYDFSNAAMKALTLAGIDTVDPLKAMSDEQLAAIPGLSEKDAKRIRKVLSYEDEDICE